MKGKYLSATILAIAVACLLIASGVFAKNSHQFDLGHYYIGMYYGPGLGEFSEPPYYFINGKCSFDVSEYKWVDHIFHDLQPLGLNLATFGDIVTPFGTVYRSDNPELPYNETWREVKEPVLDFLNATQKYGLEACLSTWVYPRPHEKKMDIKWAKGLVTDIMKRYGKHPNFKMLTPPAESMAQGLTPQDYHDISASAKEMNPDMLIMDFPNGPYSAQALESIVGTGLSPNVDIENVQFKATLPGYFHNDFAGVRGMTQAMLGGIPGKPVMIHTHYPIENGLIPMIPSQAYHVRQGAVMTATPFGIHLFNYLEMMYGLDFREGKETLWRRIKWFEGILDVQRILPPYYAHANNVADVAVLMPRYSVLDPDRLLSLSWYHVAKKGIPVRFFYDQRNIGKPSVVLVPSAQGLTQDQVTLLRNYTLDGGTTIAMTGTVGAGIEWSGLGDDTVLKVTGATGLSYPAVPPERDARLNEIFGLFLRSKIWRNATSYYWQFPFWGIRNTFGSGTGVVLSDQNTSYPIAVPEMVNEFLHKRPHFKVENLPHTYVVERWYKETPMPMEMVLFLASDPNAKTGMVKMDIPTDMQVQHAYLIDSDKLEELQFSKTANGVTTSASDLGQVSMVLLTGPQGGVPILRPEQLSEIRKTGDRIALSVDLWNIYGKAISGDLQVIPPEGWQFVAEGSLSYNLQPNQKQTFRLTLSVPQTGVERKPYFIQYKTMGLVQRTMIVPDNAPEEVITDRKPPEGGNGFGFGRDLYETDPREQNRGEQTYGVKYLEELTQ